MSTTRDRHPRIYLALDDLQCPRPFMANFFRVMGNYKVSVLMTMQTDAQWDSVDTSMPEIMRKLLAFQMDYRPESKEEAERIALRLGRYDPMGLMFPYTTSSLSHAVGATHVINHSQADGEGTVVTLSKVRTLGHQESDSEIEGTSDTTGTREGNQENDGRTVSPVFNRERGGSEYHSLPAISSGGSRSSDFSVTRSDQRSHGHVVGNSSTDGVGKAEGTSTNTIVTEGESHGTVLTNTQTLTTQQHIVGVQEQHFLRVQQLLDGTLMKRHQALVAYDDRDGRRASLLVTVDRVPSAPECRDGRPVLEQYRAAVARYTVRSERLAYVQNPLPIPRPPKPTSDQKPAKQTKATLKPSTPTTPPSWED